MGVQKLTTDILFFDCQKCKELGNESIREISISDIVAYFDMSNNPMIALPPCDGCGSLSFSEPGFDKKTIKGGAAHIRRMLLLRLLKNGQICANGKLQKPEDVLVSETIKKTKAFISEGYGSAEIKSNKTIEVARRKGPKPK
jgi:hypothetical protein